MTATVVANRKDLMTFEDYIEEFQNDPPTRLPYYVMDGVVVISPSPVRAHQWIIHTLDFLLHSFVQTCSMRVFPARMDLVMRRDPLRTRQPDVMVISNDRFYAEGGFAADGPFTIAPELVIEVLSPSENRRTLDEKIADFQAVGVSECWVISPQGETVELLSLTPDTVTRVSLYGRPDVVQSVVFPGIALPVSEILTDES